VFLDSGPGHLGHPGMTLNELMSAGPVLCIGEPIEGEGSRWQCGSDLPKKIVIAIERHHTRATGDAYPRVRAIPEIDICRAIHLMLERYGEPALDEGAARVEELARAGADDGAAVRRQTMAAITQPANTTCRPASSTHRRK
jgi:hypothetical protein